MVNPSWEDFEGPEEVNREVYSNRNNFTQIPHEEEELIQESPGDIQTSEEPEEEKPQWGDFEGPETYQGEIDPTEEESTIGYFARNIAANASRLGEQFLGKYGNIEKMGKDVLVNFPQAGGLLSWGLSQLVGPETWENIIKKGTSGILPNLAEKVLGEETFSASQVLPTSQKLKEFSQDITGGYTKPKTKGEEKFQEYVEDIGATLGGGRPVTLRNIAVNNLGIPVASNGVKDIVEGLGFGKDKGTVAKLGTWLALSLSGNVNAPQYASRLTNEGRNGIPHNVQTNVPRLQNRIQNLLSDPHLLQSDPRTALARQQITALQNDLANGQTSVRSMMTAYDGINAAKRNRGMFELTRNDQEFARRAIDRVRNVVRDEIMDAGSNHPEALQSWRNGIQAWAVIHQSRAMTNFVDSIARGPYAKIAAGPALGLFGVSSLGALKAPMIAGPLAVGVPAVYKGVQTAYRVWQDPRLQRYYWDAISAAQAENVPAFINNYNKLNKSLEKSESSKKNKKTKA